MSRLHLDFGCGSLKLVGTLDTAPSTTGLLIVSGGNEIRSGAFSGQAKLASRIARAGFPVFRFDRRGIGDSEGENRGFRSSKRDIECAIEAFRAIAPQIERVVGFGNCDAASALMLNHGSGCDGLILSNPWTIDEGPNGGGDSPPPDAIRARYLSKLKDPKEIARLLKGGVDFKKLARGLIRSTQSDAPQSSLSAEMKAGLETFEGPVSILLATADRTAQVFERHWDKADLRIKRCEGATHAYVDPAHFSWLEARVLEGLRT